MQSRYLQQLGWRSQQRAARPPSDQDLPSLPASSSIELLSVEWPSGMACWRPVPLHKGGLCFTLRQLSCAQYATSRPVPGEPSGGARTVELWPVDCGRGGEVLPSLRPREGVFPHGKVVSELPVCRKCIWVMWPTGTGQRPDGSDGALVVGAMWYGTWGLKAEAAVGTVRHCSRSPQVTFTTRRSRGAFPQ